MQASQRLRRDARSSRIAALGAGSTSDHCVWPSEVRDEDLARRLRVRAERAARRR